MNSKEALPPTPPASTLKIRAKMQAQSAKDTKPEIALRRELHRRGLRFRVGVPLPGAPRRTADIMWTGRKVAVFVDGCYWHGCPEHFHIPKTNAVWWLAKIGRNQTRDAETTELLEARGWTVIRIWEHEPLHQAADRVELAVRGARHEEVGSPRSPEAPDYGSCTNSAVRRISRSPVNNLRE